MYGSVGHSLLIDGSVRLLLLEANDMINGTTRRTSSLRLGAIRQGLALVATSVVAVSVIATSSITASHAAEKVLPQSVTVLGKPLALKDHKGNCPATPCIAEYIPNDQTFDNWTILFATRFVPGPGLDPNASAAATARKVQSEKATDPLANAALYESKDGKGAIVDFLVSSQKQNFIEHNVFRYMKSEHGIVSFQIARRIYSDKANEEQVKSFITDIPKIRGSIFKDLVRADLPEFENDQSRTAQKTEAGAVKQPK